MFETVKKFSNIIFTVKKSKMIDFLLIILSLMNGVYSIRDGAVAPQDRFSYVVSIQKSNVHLCTGTIIDDTHVLTVAHLFRDVPTADLSVVPGKDRLEPGSIHRIGVKNVYLHPQLEKINIVRSAGEDWENDIAILELEESFESSSDYEPVEGTTVEFDRSKCPNCSMITWTDSRPVLVKMWNTVFRLSPEQCIEERIHVGENQQCFIDKAQQLLITSEDLGSTIVCDDTMVGLVVKKALKDILGIPSTFLEILPYKDFFTDVLTKGLVAVQSTDAGTPQEFPYIVSIWEDENYLCGGSLLDSNHILTTAHCVWHKAVAALKVIVGLTEVSAAHLQEHGRSVHHIELNSDKFKLLSTRDGTDWYAEHDIVVLVLTEPRSFDPILEPLDYSSTMDSSPGLSCNSLHWKTERDSSGVTFKKLRKARVEISLQSSCRTALKSLGMSITPGQFCAKNKHQFKVADTGDIGTPLICRGKLTGILVKAFPSSGDSTPEIVFLSIDPYKEYIKSVLTGKKTGQAD